MTQDEFDDLLSWTMLGAMNSAVIVAQLQLQRPLTPEEIADCQEAASAYAEVIREGYQDGREEARRSG